MLWVVTIPLFYKYKLRDPCARRKKGIRYVKIKIRVINLVLNEKFLVENTMCSLHHFCYNMDTHVKPVNYFIRQYAASQSQFQHQLEPRIFVIKVLKMTCTQHTFSRIHFGLFSLKSES